MLKGSTMTLIQRDRLSRAHKGKVISEETKLKMSLAHKGRIPKNLTWLHQKNVKEQHPGWKGNKVGYSALHKWLRREIGSPVVCEYLDNECRGLLQWANKSGMYLRDVDDWIGLCVLHHSRYDYHPRDQRGRYVSK